jgi:hemolysin activation/secretion protein
MSLRRALPQGRIRRRGIASAIALACAFPHHVASAQTAPDAGSLQRDIERSRVPGAAPRQPVAPVVEEPARPALTAADSVRFHVKAFRIGRTAAFAEADLLPLLQAYTGKELTLADLQRAADTITRHYRDRGYFVARAYLPAQDIRDGVVEIVVLEGKVDRIAVRPSGAIRLHGPVVERTLRAALPAEASIREADLERGLLLLGDLPGIDVRSTLSPGAAVGASTLTAEVTEGPLVSGNVDFDNFGNKFSGPYRVGGTLNLNDPTGLGDQLNLRATESSGTHYGRLGYLLPAGSSGLKLGVAYAATRYKLCCEFASLEAKGDAQVATLNALYPLFRSRNFSLYGTAAYDSKHYFNSTVTGTTSDKKARVLALGLNGDGRDNLGGGGMNNFGLALSDGRLDLDGWAADRAADDATTRAHGRYRKTTYSLARLQRVGEATSAYAALSGQTAAKNLDSSEKFVLGGPNGVRAYPQGEAPGDEGYLLNLELRYELNPSLQVAVFVDHGEIHLHRNEWAGWNGANTRIGNRYGLSGYGAGLSWSQPGNYLVRASLAFRMGDNPGRDVNDNDSDNTRNRARFWLQAVKYF